MWTSYQGMRTGPEKEDGLPAVSVERSLPRAQALFDIRGPTLERNPMSVITVEKPSVSAPPSLCMKESTLARSPILVMSVGKPSV